MGADRPQARFMQPANLFARQSAWFGQHSSLPCLRHCRKRSYHKGCQSTTCLLWLAQSSSTVSIDDMLVLSYGDFPQPIHP